MSTSSKSVSSSPSGSNRTLHEALDAYAQSSGHLRSSAHATRLSRVGLLKQRHPDCSLTRLTNDVASRMMWEWQSRPLTRRGTPYSFSFVRQMLGELLRFFTWLDLNDEYGWSMPRGLMSSYVNVRRFVRDRQVSKQPSIYTPEQLAVLSKHATPLDRLTLFVALNCAMSSSQLGLLRVSNVLLDHEHEHAKYLGFESSPEDSWIRTRRPRTGELGEWRLWPETTAILRWGVERAHRLGSEFVFVNSEGQPMWDEMSHKPHNPFSNLWNRLLRRVRETEPVFPAFPLGSMRNVLPEFLRREYGDEMAAICLTHHRSRCLEHHSVKPFGLFHKAMMKASEFFACVFTSIKDDLPSRDD